jgi:hypothetical protein
MLEIIARHFVGLIVFGMGTRLLLGWLFSSCSLLWRKRYFKSDEDVGFLIFFLGGFITILPLIVFLMWGGIFLINDYWKFRFFEDISFFIWF